LVNVLPGKKVVKRTKKATKKSIGEQEKEEREETIGQIIGYLREKYFDLLVKVMFEKETEEFYVIEFE